MPEVSKEAGEFLRKLEKRDLRTRASERMITMNTNFHVVLSPSARAINIHTFITLSISSDDVDSSQMRSED